MKGAKCPSHTLKHMRTILDTIIGDAGHVNERLSFLPEPQGADKASKKYVKKYGGLLLELFEYLQKKSLVHWTADGQFEIKSIRVEENMREATVGDYYFIISFHTEEKADWRNELCHFILRMDEKTYKVWYTNHSGGNYREWNRYNYKVANGDSLAWGQTDVNETIINFFKSKGIYQLKYNNDLKHPELPYMRYRTDDVE